MARAASGRSRRPGRPGRDGVGAHRRMSRHRRDRTQPRAGGAGRPAGRRRAGDPCEGRSRHPTDECSPTGVQPMTTTNVAAWPLTDEQRQIVSLCRDFAAKEIRPRGREVDEADTVTPVDIFEKAAQVGITDFMIPEEFGGGGFTDVFTQCLVQEELCWGDPGIGNLVCSNGFFSDPIMVLGSEEQKKRWLTPLTGPKSPMTALATTEPESGSDAASISTTAKRVDGGYRISGQKAWISNAG